MVHGAWFMVHGSWCRGAVPGTGFRGPRAGFRVGSGFNTPGTQEPRTAPRHHEPMNHEPSASHLEPLDEPVQFDLRGVTLRG